MTNERRRCPYDEAQCEFAGCTDISSSRYDPLCRPPTIWEMSAIAAMRIDVVVPDDALVTERYEPYVHHSITFKPECFFKSLEEVIQYIRSYPIKYFKVLPISDNTNCHVARSEKVSVRIYEELQYGSFIKTGYYIMDFAGWGETKNALA